MGKTKRRVAGFHQTTWIFFSSSKTYCVSQRHHDFLKWIAQHWWSFLEKKWALFRCYVWRIGVGEFKLICIYVNEQVKKETNELRELCTRFMKRNLNELLETDNNEQVMPPLFFRIFTGLPAYSNEFIEWSDIGKV